MVETSKLREWDNSHVWHPFTPMAAYRDENPPMIERGEGFHLVDVEGRKFRFHFVIIFLCGLLRAL